MPLARQEKQTWTKEKGKRGESVRVIEEEDRSHTRGHWTEEQGGILTGVMKIENILE